MLPVLTADETARVDAASPIPASDLMRRAGVAAAHLAVTRYGIGYGSEVVVLAGPGNNGGDAYVVASVLAARGVSVSLVSFGEPSTEPARHHAVRARSISRSVGTNPDLIIDGVFGAGSRPGVPTDVADWGRQSAPILALDLPSGLEADSGRAGDGTIRADATIAFHTLKPGHLLSDGPDFCGHVEVVDIGLSGGDPAYRLAQVSDAPRPARSRTAHKWSAGSVLVVGGATGMIGAAVMAARSALAFGAGSVGLATPDVRLAQTLAPDILAYPIDVSGDRFDVWVVGPGLGDGYADLVAHAHDRKAPTVIDADALGSHSLRADHPDIVLTPHSGELRRMGGTTTRATLLKKGAPTIVEADVPWIVDTGGPELATIGTGDVLSGMIGALLARGLGGADAARSAAYWHGIAGRGLRERDGHVTATALIDEVGRLAWEHE